MDQHEAIEDMMEDMGVEKKDGPMWYLDRRERVRSRLNLSFILDYIADVVSSINAVFFLSFVFSTE